MSAKGRGAAETEAGSKEQRTTAAMMVRGMREIVRGKPRNPRKPKKQRRDQFLRFLGFL
jgi:hypothetical protein